MHAVNKNKIVIKTVIMIFIVIKIVMVIVDVILILMKDLHLLLRRPRRS